MKFLCIYILFFVAIAGGERNGTDSTTGGDLNKTLESYLEAVRGFEKKNDTLSCYNTYRSIAQIYNALKQGKKQEEYLLKALNLAEKSNNVILRSDIYLDLGRLYVERGDKEQTRKYYDKLLNISRLANDKYDLAHIYERLAKYYNSIGDKTHASQYQQKALATMKEAGVPKSIAFMHDALSELYQAENLSDSSIRHTMQAYSIAAESGNAKTQVIASLRLSQLYKQNKEIHRAIDYAEKAYHKALETKYPGLARDAASQLGDLYEKAGRYKESNIYVRQYHALVDTIQQIESTRQIALLSAQMEYEQREAELKTRIDMQQQRLRHQKWLRLLLLSVIALMCVLAYNSRKSALARKKTNVVLKEQKEELSATNEELLAVNEELNRTYKELERHREHLEEIVKDKTAKLMTALQQAQESDRFKAAFFANMSHEIRTPLNAILGFLQFIDEPSVEQDKRQEMIDLINANAMQLLLMVDDIVTLSKIDSGLLDIHPEPFNINELLDNVMIEARKMVKSVGKEKLELINETNLPGDLQPVIVDGRKIEQVFLHLLSNAIKFTERGFVMIGCEADEEQSLLHFFVEDTGVGITGEHLKFIFDRFWKQGDHYTQAFRGIGIGLSVCNELVRLMGGNISVESVPDKGSIFRFTISYEKV